MSSLTSLIDDILSRLQDDESTFSRAEIIRWLSEGYRKFCHQSRHAKTITCLDMPPRHTRAITFDWEKNTGTGSWRKWTFTHANGHSECTHLWEVQSDLGVTTGIATTCVSNLWELAYAGADVDTHYRFMLPRKDMGIIHVWHDHNMIEPVTARILDRTETHWWYIGGEPYAWTTGLGDESSFEVYEIDTTYYQSFDFGTDDLGNPRGWLDDNDSFDVDSGTQSWDYAYAWDGEPSAAASGALSGVGRRFTFGPNTDGNYYTHDWEGDAHPDQNEAATTNWWESIRDIEIGVCRTGVSSDRQYFPSYQWAVIGTIRQAAKSENAIMVYHDVYPHDLTMESEETPMIPDQMRKYLIYYALGKLFNRQGEGYDPALAGHYEYRAARAIKMLRHLGRIERLDESYARGGRQGRRREPPLPQLPANYPRAPWLR